MSFYAQMLAFIEVVETQSFSKAAAKLAVTTTAISKQIKQLESRLNQSLLERDTRKMRITDIGEQFYEHCKRVKREVLAAENFIQSQYVEPQGNLRIFSTLIFAQAYLLKNLQEFHTLYPQIQLNLELADRIPNLEHEDFDIAVGFSQVHIAPQLRQRKLLETRYVLCASPAYLQKYAAPKIPADLQNHKLINHPIRQQVNLIRFRDGREIYMAMPEIMIDNLEALVTLCCAGVGILCVCEIQVQHLLNRGVLVELLPDCPLEEISIYLCYRHTEYEQRKLRCFIDFLVKKINEN